MTDENAWHQEVATFRSAGVQPAPKDAPPKVVETKVEPKADAKADDAPDDNDAQDAVEGKLPGWLQKRVERANKKEAEADVRVAKAERTAQEALDRIAKLEAAAEARDKGDTSTKAPDPDDFDTVAEYDAAAKAWKDKQKPAAKAEPKPETKKADEVSPEFAEAFKFLGASLDKATDAAMRKLPNLSESTIIAISDIADGDKKEAQNIAAFLVAVPSVAAAIEALPANRREAALSKAYAEADLKPDPVEDKKPASKAPPPIKRSGARGETPISDDFASFEKQRNEEEISRRGRAH